MVNIIIPLYKNKKNINDCLNSLRAQTKKTFITTIIQDCDGENYDDIINNFKKDLNINFLKNEKNLGPGLTRQRGINENKMCDYLMFVDSDDMLMPQAVEVLYSYAKSNFSDIVTSKIVIDKKYNKGITCSGSRVNSWCHGKIYKADYLKQNNIRFYKEVRYNEDVAFNLLALNLTNKSYFLDKETYLFRDNKQSITRTEPLDFIRHATWQMIYGYAKGILEISEKEKLNTNLAISALLTLYTQSQILIESNGITKDENELVKKVLKLNKIQTILENKKHISYIITHCKSGEILYKEPVFFHESFDAWIKRLINLNILK